MYLPYYNCNTVYDAVTRAGLCGGALSVGRAPSAQVCPALGDGEWLLYVNYFGIASDDLLAEVKAPLAAGDFDNTRAFFQRPVWMPTATTSIPAAASSSAWTDGAYLVHGTDRRDLPGGRTSWQHAAFCSGCIDESVNSAYGDSLDNEAALTARSAACRPRPGASSRPSSTSPAPAPPRQLRALHAALAPHNALDCPADADAMIYPFLCRVDGLRGRLIKNKVYVSQWWKYLLELLPATDSVEADYSRYTCCRCPSTSATRPTICARWRRWCCS